MAVTLGVGTKQRMPLLEHWIGLEKGALEDDGCAGIFVSSAFEEFSTASTIPVWDKDGSPCHEQAEEGEICDVTEVEDGEIFQPVELDTKGGQPVEVLPEHRWAAPVELDTIGGQPVEVVTKGGLSQAELDELCVDSSDDHRSSTEDGELTDDDDESEICFERQLEAPCDLNKGLTPMESDKSKVASRQLVKEVSRHATQSPRQDHQRLECLALSPRGRRPLHQAAPAPLQRHTLLLPSKESDAASSGSVFDTATQERLSSAFSSLLSSDAAAVELAAVDLVVKIAHALGPQLDSTACKKMELNSIGNRVLNRAFDQLNHPENLLQAAQVQDQWPSVQQERMKDAK